MNDSQKTLDCIYCVDQRCHPPGSPCGMANSLKEGIEKGHKGGECNRTACRNWPAMWWNKETRYWYCEDCMRRIQRLSDNVIFYQEIPKWATL